MTVLGLLVSLCLAGSAGDARSELRKGKRAAQDGRVGDAVEHFERGATAAAEAWPEDHRKRLEIEALLAGAYQTNLQSRAAMELLETLFPRVEATYGAGSLEVLQLQFWHASALGGLGRPGLAIARLETLLAELRERGEPLAGVQQGLAEALFEAGRYRDALEVHEQAVSGLTTEGIYDDLDRLVGRADHARYLFFAGHPDRALAALEPVLEGAEEAWGPVHPNTATLLDLEAELRGHRGELGEAMRLRQRALEIRTLEAPEDVVLSHVNLGKAWMQLGDLDVAGTHFETALERLSPGHGLYPHAWLGLANVKERTGDLEGALEALSEARQHMGEGRGRGWIDTAAASLALQLEQWEEAERLGQALAQSPDVDTRYTGWVTRVEVALARGDLEVAQASFDEALALWPHLGTLRQVKLLLVEVRLREALGADARGAARRSYDESRRLTELADGVLSEVRQIRIQRVEREALRALLRTGTAESAAEDWSRSLSFKGQALRSHEATTPELAAVRQELAHVALMSVDPSETSWRSGRIEALTVEKEALEAELSAPTPAPSPEELCGALPEGVGYVDWFALDSGYVAFVVDADCTVVRVDVPRRVRVDQLVTRSRTAVQDGGPTVDAARLRALVWDPIQRALGDATTVWMSPDGGLLELPWSALPVDEGFLVETHTISLVDDPRSIVETRVPGGGDALVVGGVDYGLADGQGDCTWTWLAGLPGTTEEAEIVSLMVGGSRDVVRLEKEEATEERTIEAATGAGVIHLATHGIFAASACHGSVAERNPLVLTGVALSDANHRFGTLRSTDGVWTAEEIATVRLEAAPLVVLSGCDTGRGAVEDGEGVLGLRRAFVQAGASAVVLSLWPVADAGAVDVMGLFYRQLLDEDQPVGVALAEARREAIARGLPPATWAAFTLAGNPRAGL